VDAAAYDYDHGIPYIFQRNMVFTP